MIHNTPNGSCSKKVLTSKLNPQHGSRLSQWRHGLLGITGRLLLSWILELAFWIVRLLFFFSLSFLIFLLLTLLVLVFLYFSSLFDLEEPRIQHISHKHP
ncbi:hypothetical protein I7I53_11445 [Histoplasma capsulatum var. duboisii H88]|uniref:Uncharacterized protein n=1 Tax=Ajellomyces capsulatus (strain H88) TaxID=544711 RepID=A0A8A1L9D0_AJEC8|nr:hypothetical protein I7I53_11445 [Histoplasma capsulatum var. duboisii H88]